MSVGAVVPADAREHTLVLSSGRCGSTLLLDMLGDHPDVAPLVEFFGSQYQAGMDGEPMDGERFWDLLSAPWLSLNTAIRLGRVPAEVRYDVSRRPAGEPMCGLLAFTLPALTPDPDAVFAELADEIPSWPERPLGAHYGALFDRLLAVAGRTRWVEKSATSAEYADDLLDLLPGARVVLLTRDVIDVAISMTHHPMFVFADLSVMFLQRCGVDPFRAGSMPPGHPVPDDLVPFLPRNITCETLDARAGSFASILNLVMAQAHELRRAEDALAGIDPARVHRVRYESLLGEPERTLGDLGDFLQLDDPGRWVDEVSSQIRPARPPRIDIGAADRSMLLGVYDQVFAAAGAA